MIFTCVWRSTSRAQCAPPETRHFAIGATASQALVPVRQRRMIVGDARTARVVATAPERLIVLVWIRLILVFARAVLSSTPVANRVRSRQAPRDSPVRFTQTRRISRLGS